VDVGGCVLYCPSPLSLCLFISFSSARQMSGLPPSSMSVARLSANQVVGLSIFSACSSELVPEWTGWFGWSLVRARVAV
jgi:hypothetical protein